MKKIQNTADTLVRDELEGYAAIHKKVIRLLPDSTCIVRAVPKEKGKVKLVMGNGAGHEPAVIGWVGEGMFDMNIVGDVFTAPSADKILNGLQAIDDGSPILLIVQNHAGDVLNANQAYKKAKKLGMDIHKVLFYDDIASAPRDEVEERRGMGGRMPARQEDLFMGFHCGNAPVCRMKNPKLESHKILGKNLPEGALPSITEGTLEGELVPGDITVFRLQSTARGELRAYVAQGSILDVPCHSFGSIGVFCIPEMERFYRYALLEHCFPHHGAVAFSRVGRILYDVFRYLGIEEIDYNRPAHERYPAENPFL